MTKCPPEERLGAFFDGELPEAEAAAIEAHVGSCAACSGELASLRELYEVAGSWQAPAVSEAEWQTTWQAIAERVDARRRRGVWRPRVAWAVAVAAALTLAAGLYALRGGAGRPGPELAREHVAEVDDIEAAPGYETMVSYSPDSDVTLITVMPVASKETPRNDAGRNGTL